MLWKIVVAVLLVVVVAEVAVLTSAECVCANSPVDVRVGPSTYAPRRGILPRGSCVSLRWSETRYILGSHWWHVDYKGQDCWIRSNRLLTKDSSCSRGPVLSEESSEMWDRSSVIDSGSASVESAESAEWSRCPSVISRSSWGARSPRYTLRNTAGTPSYVILHHSGSASCSSQSLCQSRVRAIQYDHMYKRSNRMRDVAYNFLVGEDGNVYEGRGWGKQGAHTPGYDTKSIGIGVIGDFNARAPNAAALRAIQSLVACGVRQGHIRSNYRLRAHSDVRRSVTCPGKEFADVINRMPRH